MNGLIERRGPHLAQHVAMKLRHATLCIVTSATFAIGALGLQGCSDNSSSTGDASPTVDSAVSDSAIDSAQESSSDSAQPVKDSGQESSADSAAESAADAVADGAGDSLIGLPLDSSLDGASPGLDAAVLADGSGDSSDARLE
jgi:hypothetical protein